MPGYQEYRAAAEAASQMPRRFGIGQWTSDTKFQFRKGDKTLVYDFTTDKVTEGGELTQVEQPLLAITGGPQQAPARGRQYTEERSPVGGYSAVYRDGNVYLKQEDGTETPITTEGDPAKRIKFGTASWVYGEELSQRHAMGFSPDGKFLWIYRFDENPVKDYHLTVDQRTPQTSLYIEAYPKPGTKNPIVDLYIWEVATKKMVKVQVRDGEFDKGVGHYVIQPAWSADGSELFFYRLDRRQKIKEMCAANPKTGEIRVVDREESPADWVEYTPIYDVRTRARGAMPVVEQNLMILSEVTDYAQLYWLDTKTGKRVQITHQKGDVVGLELVDDVNKKIYYMASDGSTPYRHQFHVVNFDGTGDKVLTDPKLHHTVSVSPNGKYYVVESETSTQMPVLRAMTIGGEEKEILLDPEPQATLNGFSPTKWYSFPSLDGKVTLYGTISFPRNFDPSKKYPILVSVYAGPGMLSMSGPSEQFSWSSSMASYGFLIVNINGRGEGGRGKAFRKASYRKLGIIEIDDQAAGVKALQQFPWADTSRVGIFGTSYGGFASAMCLLRYPDLFHAASSSSMVSYWGNYDTTYTERYMDLLEENPDGYKQGSPMTYAQNLKGWLMLYYGTADDNTHPTNTYQLADALTKAGKFYELQVGVDRGHSGLNMARMMEFFIERLVIDGPRK